MDLAEAWHMLPAEVVFEALRPSCKVCMEVDMDLAIHAGYETGQMRQGSISSPSN
jgi:hypothetical protein